MWHTWLALNSSASIVDPDLPWAMITIAVGNVPLLSKLPPTVREGSSTAVAPEHVKGLNSRNLQAFIRSPAEEANSVISLQTSVVHGIRSVVKVRG